MRKNYMQCVNCVYYVQHYSISHKHINKVCDGHCTFHKQGGTIKNCPDFKQIDEKEEKVKREKDVITILKDVLKTLKHLQIYLNKTEDVQRLGVNIKEDEDFDYLFK